jgi:predicted O-methyltransferase YrrM
MRKPDYPSADADRWGRVDEYFSGLLAPHDAVLDEDLKANAQAGLPPGDVSATQGQLLAIFVRMIAARRVLEIGTLGAYSTIWMGRALGTAGKIVTIELDPGYAVVARNNIKRAGLAERVELHVGSALDILPALHSKSAGPFDLIFIDADKPNNPAYLQWALRLSRPGTVIVGDNVVRGGAVADASSVDQKVLGVREFLNAIAVDSRLTATAIQTVGEKGWDGFAIAIVGEF